MKWLFSAIGIFICFHIYAQDNYEIQVYASQTQAKNSTIFELHSNYTFDGEREIKDGVRPSYHALHETIEITHGISDIFELGFYLFMNYTSGYGYQVIGTHLRPRIMAPSSWKLPVGLSLSTEIGYQRAQYSADTWTLELRPIIDKQWNRLYVSLNPTLGLQLKGVPRQPSPGFAPNVKVGYGFFKNLGAGLEYYGDLGAVNNFKRSEEQGQAVFIVADLINNPDWELNMGPGFGLTPATDRVVFKILVGRRIKWK